MARQHPMCLHTGHVTWLHSSSSKLLQVGGGIPVIILGGADVGCEVKSGILMMAEQGPSFGGCARRQGQLPVSTFAELLKKSMAAEHARAFVCSL